MQLRLDSVVELPPRSAYGRTFRETKARGVHRWYSYVEGFSADYLSSALDEVGGVPSCYDPFGGTGTTLVEASHRGIESYYAESNPFMAFVIEAKVNSGAWAARHRREACEALGRYARSLSSTEFAALAREISLERYAAAFPGRDFFDEDDLRELLAAVKLAQQLEGETPHVAHLALLACAANVVGSSHMTRRADLRRRRADEYKTRQVDVAGSIRASIEAMVADIGAMPNDPARTHRVATDCRHLDDRWAESFDAAVTSPPYLNGTNYVRNTKLELFVLDFIRSEDDLGALRRAAVRGGITQAATSIPVGREFPEVEDIASQLDEVAGDRRIPHMVRAYFSDMYDVLRAVFHGLRPGGCFLLDIGDSRFYGVNVPTDTLLGAVAERTGFELRETRVLAARYSRDKTPLVQAELVLRKPA